MAQAERRFDWIVLLHRADALLAERRAAFAAAGARFIYTDEDGTPAHVAFVGYRAGWADAIGPRDDQVAMTRLDDDDALAPWVTGRIRAVASKLDRRMVLVCPIGVRVWDGCYMLVRHNSNAMQTLVTPPGDVLTVYDYKHREVRKVAQVRMIDPRPAWVWARHLDTLSGWRMADRPLSPSIRGLFPIDWSLFGDAPGVKRAVPSKQAAGRLFR